MTSIKYIITEPDGYLYVDPDNVITGEEANKDAVITMELSGDTIIKFWTKQTVTSCRPGNPKDQVKGPHSQGIENAAGPEAGV